MDKSADLKNIKQNLIKLIKKNKIISIFILTDVLFFIIYIIFNKNSYLTENIYSKKIFPVLTTVMGFITDLFDFSVIEILIILFILLLIAGLVFLIILKVKNRINIKQLFIILLKSIFIILSVTIVWFYSMWGFNYFRMPIAKKTGIINENKQITDELFNSVLDNFIDKTNYYYEKTLNFKTLPSAVELNPVIEKNLADTILLLDNIKIRKAQKMKTSITFAIENSNIAGVVSPFTLESHYSSELFLSELPFVMAHEKSHLYGYAHETEANYIAFLACVNSDDYFLKYSGYSEILIYFLNQYAAKLKSRDPGNWKEKYIEKFNKLNPGVINDYTKQRERYEKYDNALNKLGMDIYNLYLKSNKVESGTVSYSLVTQLIMKTEMAF